MVGCIAVGLQASYSLIGYGVGRYDSAIKSYKAVRGENSI